jgi:hypothetical protein
MLLGLMIVVSPVLTSAPVIAAGSQHVPERRGPLCTLDPLCMLTCTPSSGTVVLSFSRTGLRVIVVRAASATPGTRRGAAGATELPLTGIGSISAPEPANGTSRPATSIIRVSRLTGSKDEWSSDRTASLTLWR